MNPFILKKKKSTQIKEQLPVKKIITIRAQLSNRLMRQYSTSEGFFYSKIISNIVQKKEGDKNCIIANDLKHDDNQQHMQKYYKSQDRKEMLPQLLQYYKYYSQESICFLSRQFEFLAVHHEKKKAVVYEKLKKQLNISDSENSMVTIVKTNSPKKFDNVLSSLSGDSFQDESYLLNQMMKKLVIFYGPSQLKTINKIDSEFNFSVINRALIKSKKGNNYRSLNNLLNFSIKNEQGDTLRKSNIDLKKKMNKNLLHRRFVSCQIPKSAQTRNISNQNDTNKTNNNFKEGKDKKRTQQRRRRKTAENICQFDSNLISSKLQNYKSVTLKTEEPRKYEEENKIEKKFRSKMQQIRSKIRQDKQNISKKQQSTCFIKKKYKKF